MIRSAEMIRFDRLSDSGRNRPPRVAILTDNGEEVEAVMKPAGWKELQISSVTKELISSVAGGLVGLPICEPFLVRVDAQLIEAIPDNGIKAQLRNCVWPAYASQFAGSQWQNWSTGDALTPERLAQGLAVLFFDAVSDNADRGGNTPNLLVKGDQLRAIDHEMCFSTTQLIGMAPPAPWTPGSMDWLRHGPKKNVLLEPAAKAGDPDFGPIRAAWTGLADAEIDAILTLLPQSWVGAQALALHAIQRLKGVRDNIDACIVELERVLAQ
jgi:HipA-like protein